MVPWISVDDHLVEPADLFQRRLPAGYRDRAPRVVRIPWERGPGFRQGVRPAATGPEVDCWMFEDIPQFMINAFVAVGLRPDQLDNSPTSYADMPAAFLEPKARLAAMDVVGCDRSMCFPNWVRFCGQMFLWMKDKDVAMACVQAYNDWMVEEWCGDSGGRLLAVGLVPMWDPVAAAAEVRRNAARGVRAVAFSELPAAIDLPSIHAPDGHWLPLFEACDETGTVVCMHIGSSSRVPTTSPDAPTGVALASTHINAQLAMTDWLLSGLLARFPNLKLAFSESQIGWMPFVKERVDNIWKEGNAFVGLSERLVDPPSSYMKDRVFGCFFEDDFGLAVRDAVDVDLITFECDYPHQDSTWPDTPAYIERALASCTEDEAYRILRGNALKMLGLPDPLPR